MPCHDLMPVEGYRHKEVKERLDKVTRLLCDLCKEIDDCGDTFYFGDELLEWWEDHRINDMKCLAEESQAQWAKSHVHFFERPLTTDTVEYIKCSDPKCRSIMIFNTHVLEANK